jgi:hypothetical protein
MPRAMTMLPFIMLASIYAATIARSLWTRALYGNYCGPNYPNNFSLAPVDAVDALCLQHDYCIEKSVEDAYGTGTRVPLRSHRVPRFGCMIAECDRQFVELTESQGMLLSQPTLPQHPRFTGMLSAVFGDADVCSQHWGLAYSSCRLFVWLAREYHISKIADFIEAVKGDRTAFDAIPACSTLLAAFFEDVPSTQHFLSRSQR